MSKPDHADVVRFLESMGITGHWCHATGCETQVRRELFMCRRHWYLVPPRLRRGIWNAYRPGQCDDKNPSREYCEVAKAAVIAVAAKERRDPDTSLYDLLLSRDSTKSVIARFVGEYRFLSNFHASEVEHGGMIFPTAEHAYQAAKTTKREQRIKIRNASSASVAKKLGRAVTLRSDWEDVKLSVMGEIVREKFKNRDLAARLLETGSAILIEGNDWDDNYWGATWSFAFERWFGENHLGKILMAVRREVRRDNKGGGNGRFERTR